MEDLLKPENKGQLVKILTYHVVPGKIMSGSIASKQVAVRTVEGGELYANGLSAQGLTVSASRTYNSAKQANVVSGNIETDNGVIHVIDKVLIPGS